MCGTIYNICDHQECYAEVQSQAISYTTGVPAMINAKMLLENKWSGNGVFNIEQMDPDPFMDDLKKQGRPWKVVELLFQRRNAAHKMLLPLHRLNGSVLFR